MRRYWFGCISESDLRCDTLTRFSNDFPQYTTLFSSKRLCFSVYYSSFCDHGCAVGTVETGSPRYGSSRARLLAIPGSESGSSPVVYLKDHRVGDRFDGRSRSTSHQGVNATKLAIITSILTAVASITSTNPAALRSSADAQIEQALVRHVTNRDTTFTLTVPASDYGHLEALLTQALQANPYLAHDYTQDGYSGTENTSGQAIVHFRVVYTESKTQYFYVVNRVNQILKQIIKPGMSDLAKELAIHDYIVLHTAYDQSLTNTTPYDALTKRTTVCNGYAMLTYLMMSKAGIPSKIVDGNAGGASHAWNMVEVGGRWYNLDTTWDDPVPDQPGHIHYDYFNMTDAQIMRDHQRLSKGMPPATTDFVALLEKERGSNPGAEAVLTHTRLYVESPSYTFNSIAALKTALSSQSSTFTFRFPDSQISLLSTVPLTLRGGSFEYTQDRRYPGYDIVTWRFN